MKKGKGEIWRGNNKILEVEVKKKKKKGKDRR